MATANFWTMREFPLMVVGDEDVVKMFIDKEEGEEYDSDDVSIAWDIWDCCLNDEFGIQTLIDDLNDGLQWYKVELKYGYYSGVQLYVYSEYEDFNSKWFCDSSVYLWEDEDCELEFGLTREETREMIKQEKEKILEFLKQSKDCGFRELLCCGVFGNGEAVYEYVDRILK